MKKRITIDEIRTVTLENAAGFLTPYELTLLILTKNKKQFIKRLRKIISEKMDK